jgi:hypothetical protein
MLVWVPAQTTSALMIFEYQPGTIDGFVRWRGWVARNLHGTRTELVTKVPGAPVSPKPGLTAFRPMRDQASCPVAFRVPTS